MPVDPVTPTIHTESEIRAASTMRGAIASARRAFGASFEGAVTAPPSWTLDLPRDSEAHVKGAYLGSSDVFVIKVATAYEAAPGADVAVSSGFSSVFDVATGTLRAILLDNGYLTELRTGAAGGLALDLLAPSEVDTVVIVGAGLQARFQIEGVLAVRTPRRIIVVSRNRSRAQACADWTRERTDALVEASTDVADAVARADVIVTATPSVSPLFDASLVRPGTHITAVGSDSERKRELDERLLRRADAVVVDDVAQSRRLGELKGIEDALLKRPALTLGAIAVDPSAGRRSADDITIADLSGLGVQDAAIAELTLDNLRS